MRNPFLLIGFLVDLLLLAPSAFVQATSIDFISTSVNLDTPQVDFTMRFSKPFV
jgi:hypothetical protein